MENECEALPGVAYPGVRDNRKTGYDDDGLNKSLLADSQHHASRKAPLPIGEWRHLALHMRISTHLLFCNVK